jgi:hypothetical protein
MPKNSPDFGSLRRGEKEKKKKIVDNFEIYISRASKQVQHLVEIDIFSAFMKEEEEEEEEEEYSFFFHVEVLGRPGWW